MHWHLFGATGWASLGSAAFGSSELESVASSATGVIGEGTGGRALSSSMSRRTPDQTPVTQEEFDLLKAELVLCKAEIDWVPYS